MYDSLKKAEDNLVVPMFFLVGLHFAIFLIALWYIIANYNETARNYFISFFRGEE